jgi:hypothetical protein
MGCLFDSRDIEDDVLLYREERRNIKFLHEAPVMNVSATELIIKWELHDFKK